MEVFIKGYQVFPKVIPDELCDRVVGDIEIHAYGGTASYGDMLEMYHYQSMWDVRQHPDLHATFSCVLLQQTSR